MVVLDNVQRGRAIGGRAREVGLLFEQANVEMRSWWISKRDVKEGGFYTLLVSLIQRYFGRCIHRLIFRISYPAQQGDNLGQR